MEIFLNEFTLHGQYKDVKDFEPAFKTIIDLLRAISEINKNKNVFICNKIYLRNVTYYTNLTQTLDRFTDKSIYRQFRVITVNKLSVKDWMDEQLHNESDKFTYEGEDIAETSMAEVAARNLLINMPRLLLNFRPSCIVDNTVVITYKGGSIELQSFCDPDELNSFLLLKGYKDDKYNFKFGSVLSVKQTILRDTARFKFTGQYSILGTKIFKEKSNGYYWYIDNFHTGKSVHLEVFDRKKDHVGEADLDGNLVAGSKDLSRRLKI